MPLITDFYVEGLAGRAEAIRVTLQPDTNVFFGINGSGKTSLLKILHSALSGEGSALSTVPFHRAEVSIKQQSRSVRVTFDKQSHDRHQAELFELVPGRPGSENLWKATPKWDVDPLEAFPKDGFPHAYLSTARLLSDPRDEVCQPGSASWSQRSRAPVDEQLDTRFAEFLDRLWQKYYFDVLWRVRQAQEQGLATLLLDTLTSADSEASPESSSDTGTVYRRVKTFLTRQRSRALDALGTVDEFLAKYESDDRLRAVTRHVNKVEQRIERIMTPSNKLEELVRRLFSNKQVQFGQRGLGVHMQEEAIPLASLSSGEKHVLRLFIEAVPSPGNCIIIDEPELSLHVDWQRVLIESLRQLAPKSQIIVATHSPEIMADLEDRQIYQL